jgi:ornithine carbamoyltransferase
MAELKTKCDLKGRSLLTLADLTDSEMMQLIGLARELKERKASGVRGDLLRRKSVAMIFEKMSTRTRCATSVAAFDEGGRAEYLAAHDIHLGKKESVADTAMVLGRMFDAILFRGFKQETVVSLAANSGIPVWNGLTDESHPTQTLADLMTVQEEFGELAGLKFVYVGDGRNNVVNSLMMGCAKAGMHFVNCTPEELMPEDGIVACARKCAEATGGSVTVTADHESAVEGANVVYTDVWVSMGEEAQAEERIKLLMPYQVNMAMLERTGNIESGRVIFLHCLPAFHDKETEVTKTTGALEVSDDVFKSPFSRVFDEAENRMHTIKALMVATVSDS